MHKSLSVLLIATLTLSACSRWSESRVNPSNWFGSSTPAPVDVSPDDANALVPQQSEGVGLFSRGEEEDTSVPIAMIDELRIDPTPNGAIVYVTGTASRQGAFNARLQRVESEENTQNGVIEYSFRVEYPSYATAQGNARSRMVSDAVNLSRQQLAGVRLVRVTGAQNALESRRR